MGDEADALYDINTDREAEEAMRESDIEEMKWIYRQNKRKPTGSKCPCPVCLKGFIKKTANQAFCGGKKKGRSTCKDRYWNIVNEKYYGGEL